MNKPIAFWKLTLAVYSFILISGIILFGVFGWKGMERLMNSFKPIAAVLAVVFLTISFFAFRSVWRSKEDPLGIEDGDS